MALKIEDLQIAEKTVKRAELLAQREGMSVDQLLGMLFDRYDEPEGYDAYVRESVMATMDSHKPTIPLSKLKEDTQKIID